MLNVLEVNVDDLGFGGVFSLVRSVIEHKQPDLSIDIATIEVFEKKSNINYLAKFGTKVYYIGYKGNKLAKQIVCFYNLMKLIKRNKYDCIHIHADVANKLFVSGIAGKISGAKRIILHSHASGVDGNHRKLKMIYHKCCRRFLKFIGSDFVSCSDLAAAWMFPNLSQSKVTTIKNGVDLEKFRFNPQARMMVRHNLGIENATVLGHIGRFAYQKNHTFLIDIFAKLKKQMPNAILLLIGEGDLEPIIRNKVTCLGLNNDVIFYGTSNKAFELYQAMDVFVLPSKFEGLPLVGVEAQASGLPVIFSDKVTRKAKLTDNVYFLPVEDGNDSVWIEKIVEMQRTAALESRSSTYMALKEKGFDIYDTIITFLNLYMGGESK